ncbi:phospholipid carrier-dependent glycosyltransferase [Sphingomonas aliaeris]|uniref:Polyprenol-phosphate-mannose--protein mannosyltransferase n=1 Tax=Sphingomonas aliaeris TaxID=2759526 RepID=A0A974NWC4_9SPHN|nr:phospholipid carrier-dependent glycosyltransferase [Sphingomonas aliaeris]QQV78121.1 phospholipid carrier-dependent glycosyltransferase [Sphingomonas aliaeris]
MAAPRPRPIMIATAIGAAAQFLFTLNISRPSILLFDEVHYVRAARILMTLDGPANIEHPMLGKSLIALGIRLLGDNQYGWRLLSSVAATAVVLGVFWILWELFHRVRPAAIGALLVVLNGTVFVQARIGMLDGFMAAFLILGMLALIRSAFAPPDRAWRHWILGSVLLGLAVGVKWTAAPDIAFAGIGFLLVRRYDASRGGVHWQGMRPIPALATLGLVSVVTYLLTFAPAFFYARDPLTPSTLLPFQWTMYLQQTQVLPAHTYQSSWWTWPLMIRPIWYLYELVDGAQRGVLLIGNPAVMWGGLVAVAYCLWAGWRRRSVTLLGIGSVWVASLAIWAIIPKSLGFYYYYYPSSIFLCLALAAALDDPRGRGRHWDTASVAVSAVLFVYFYPILSAAALPDAEAFRRWMWFPTWP